jgi:hypothetical protein
MLRPSSSFRDNDKSSTVDKKFEVDLDLPKMNNINGNIIHLTVNNFINTANNGTTNTTGAATAGNGGANTRYDYATGTSAAPLKQMHALGNGDSTLVSA